MVDEGGRGCECCLLQAGQSVHYEWRVHGAVARRPCPRSVVVISRLFTDNERVQIAVSATDRIRNKQPAIMK